MKTKSLILRILGLMTILSLGAIYVVHAGNGDVTLTIKGIGLRHGTPENFSLGSVTGSLSNQYVSGHFTDYFRVEDLEGYTTGHYTTIQCDGVYGPYGVVLTGVDFMAGSGSPELILGNPGPNVKINTVLSSYTSILEPVTYIYKETNTNNMGLANKYGDKPWLRILIPPTAPAGTYSGTIVFSFYMY